MVIKKRPKPGNEAVAILLGLAVASALFSAQTDERLISSLPNGVQMEFVRIPAGGFMMGCSPGDGQCADDEKPAHMVRITRAFEVGKYEVTEAQWQAVMVDAPYVPAGGQDYAYGLTGWITAQSFVERLTARDDGYKYRLPTEAEWEYAARAGTKDAFGGASPDAVAWFGQNAAGKPNLVGQRRPNAWGIYDMQGNVWEWVSDFYDEKYYSSSQLSDPQGPPTGQYRVLRGGSLVSNAARVRVSARSFVGLPIQQDFFGFRVVRESAR
jgi:formylglycine-generating enzyme required for sulfatase activity